MAGHLSLRDQGLFALLAVYLASQLPLSSGLQVTPNSPCSSLCRDSPDLDASDPGSSSTRNSDITCEDAAYSSAAGTKFKNCMECLQTSTFSQGAESDTMWFLYNLRYATAYCVFGFPNATGIQTSPCITRTACGHLQASLEHGIPDPRNSTAYSYCSAGAGEAMASSNFDTCIPCVSAEGTTEYLANYLVALRAGCEQQPAPGVLLGLNDTVFSQTRISIVDPETLAKGDDEDSKPTLAIPVIVGIVAGVVVFLLIVAGAAFVCLRRRRNKRQRASAEADFYRRVNQRHRSSMSFQCQTHIESPRFWPGTPPAVSAPAEDYPDRQAQRSSIWKPQDAEHYPHDQDSNAPYPSKKAALAAVPQITTSVPPARPPQAYASPSSAGGGGGGGGGGSYNSPSDFRIPLSAESVRSTSALLPSIRPYVPAEHGVHVQTSPSSSPPPPPTATTTTGDFSPVPGAGMTPLLKGQGAWPLVDHHHYHQQKPLPQPQEPQPQKHHHHQHQRKHIVKINDQTAPSPPPQPTPPPPPPPLKTSRSSGLLAGWKGGKHLSGGAGTGSPVESWEIQTAFAAPPKR